MTKSKLSQIETSSFSGSILKRPCLYSGVALIINIENDTQTIEKRSHFKKTLLLVKNKKIEIAKIAKEKWTTVLVIGMLFPPKHFTIL